MLILTAIGAVYIVLGIPYESYVHPITILSTLPPAGVGNFSHGRAARYASSTPEGRINEHCKKANNANARIYF